MSVTQLDLLSWRPAAQRTACYLCGVTCDDTKLGQDHVHPRSRGGSNSDSNLRPCCRPCNRLKGRWTLDEFRERCLAVVWDAPDSRFTKVHPSRVGLYWRIVEHMGWLSHADHMMVTRSSH